MKEHILNLPTKFTLNFESQVSDQKFIQMFFLSANLTSIKQKNYYEILFKLDYFWFKRLQHKKIVFKVKFINQQTLCDASKKTKIIFMTSQKSNNMFKLIKLIAKFLMKISSDISRGKTQ